MTIFQRIQLAGGELVVYEAFIDFCPEHTVRHDVQQGMSVVGSLIKTLCIPGVRLGYVCADPNMILKLEKRSLPWSLITLASAVAADRGSYRQNHESEWQRDGQFSPRPV